MVTETNHPPLEDLVGACIAGDRDAMQQIYEQCSDRVYALMVRIVGRQDADDLTQQVFLQMFREAGSISAVARSSKRGCTAWQRMRRCSTCAKRNARQSQPLVIEPSASDTDRLHGIREASNARSRTVANRPGIASHPVVKGRTEPILSRDRRSNRISPKAPSARD